MSFAISLESCFCLLVSLLLNSPCLCACWVCGVAWDLVYAGCNLKPTSSCRSSFFCCSLACFSSVRCFVVTVCTFKILGSFTHTHSLSQFSLSSQAHPLHLFALLWLFIHPQISLPVTFPFWFLLNPFFDHPSIPHLYIDHRSHWRLYPLLPSNFLYFLRFLELVLSSSLFLR